MSVHQILLRDREAYADLAEAIVAVDEKLSEAIRLYEHYANARMLPDAAPDDQLHQFVDGLHCGRLYAAKSLLSDLTNQTVRLKAHRREREKAKQGGK